jgi:hypothetical protein
LTDTRVILTGPCFATPQYYGRLSWTSTDVYLRHPLGGKDSRHSDGGTFLTSDGADRAFEQRVPTSEITRELLNYIALPSGAPRPLEGAIRPSDIVVSVDSATSRPRIAVEIVSNSSLAATLADWQTRSGVSSVCSVVPKGRAQSLLLAIAER